MTGSPTGLFFYGRTGESAATCRIFATLG